MKLKILFSLMFSLTLLFGNVINGYCPTWLVDVEKVEEFNKLKSQYSWLNENVYILLKKNTIYYDIDIVLMCSLIQWESGSYCKNNLKKMRVVNSHAGAIGICQIMPFHVRKPKVLYELSTNIQKGSWYLNRCLIKSEKENRGKGNIKIFAEACRMYNQGLHGKRYKYKNWKYVKRIVRSFLLYKEC